MLWNWLCTPQSRAGSQVPLSPLALPNSINSGSVSVSSRCNPKSATRASRNASRRILPGLMSPWMYFLGLHSWMCARPWATPCAIRSLAFHVRNPLDLSDLPASKRQLSHQAFITALNTQTWYEDSFRYQYSESVPISRCVSFLTSSYLLKWQYFQQLALFPKSFEPFRAMCSKIRHFNDMTRHQPKFSRVVQ